MMPHHVEAFESSSWILLDYGSTLVHIFCRKLVILPVGNLWKDGENIPLSDLGIDTKATEKGHIA